MERRVVITGLGTINPLGNNVEQFWNNLIAGKSGLKKIDKFDVSKITSRIAGMITNFNSEDYFDKRELRRLSTFIMYGLVATDEAVKDSHLDLERENHERIGVITGSGIGGIEEIENQHDVLREKGIDRISPFFIIKMITDMIPGKISMKYNLKGPNFSVSSACASSAHSMITAFSMVKYGYADIMVTGGVEAPITDLTLGAFCSLKALSTGYNDTPERASRPFDGKRDGFVIAEGAGTLIFEEYEHAIRRGARIYGEILGTGATADAFHDTAPAPRGEGGRRAMELALKEGCIEKEKVEYINAHGTSTKANDLNETLSVKDLFGDYAKKLAISSTKSMTGHTLGASAAIEAIASLLTMQNGIIPPTINYENPEPELDLDYVPNIAREKKVDYVLSNSFGFGGHNGVLLLGRI
jgi:3-oxoacyl-[acyl-carrier-protein] synthase II